MGSTVRDYREEDLVTMFCYFAPVNRHGVQTMCTMFYRKDFFRLFDGLLRISTRKTNAEPTCLTSLGGHDGAICAAKHHAYHLANPYSDNEFLVSKETVVLRRWERSKQKFGFIKRVDKG